MAQPNLDVVVHVAECEQGLAEAQFTLGYMYGHAKGAPHSNSEAVKWYRRAAEQGDIDGQNELGIAYRDGRGVSGTMPKL